MAGISPRTYFNRCLYDKLENVKLSRRPKVSRDEFVVPIVSDYSCLLQFNYNVSQLRCIARLYRQKISGNKRQLVGRLYNYMRYSTYAVKIQALCRGYLRRYYNWLRGPARRDHECVNTTDFLYLKDLKELNHGQFFSFLCSDNKVYGFDIKSLYNLIDREISPRNPYNRNLISSNIRQRITSFVRLGRILCETVDITIKDETAQLSHKKKIELKALSLFQELDSFGHVTDSKWLLGLGTLGLIRFLKELADIWLWRSELVIAKRKSICPPLGNPFLGMNISGLVDANILTIRHNTLCIIENLITKAPNRDDRALGAFYVLGALTLVSTSAAVALPWLYESFAPNNPV